jgi:glycine/D-amino acid oxidase-like deaminating enzyme
MLQELGIPLRELSAEDFRELQPFCGAEDVGGVAYEPFSGYADPRLATLAFVRQAARRGLRVLEGVEVTELLRHGDRIVGVQTDRGEIRAGTVVLAGNIGAVPLASCAGLLLPVRPRRIGICFTEWVPAAGQPPLCTYIDDSIGTYFRPEPHGRVLVGIRSKERAAHTDPAEADHTVRLCEMLEARARLARRIPGMREAEFVGARAGVDGYTPDEHALIGRIREMEGLYVAVGFSGGGFKVAPAVGRAVASELLYEREAPVLKAFRPDRFEAGCTIRAEHAYAYM